MLMVFLSVAATILAKRLLFLRPLYDRMLKVSVVNIIKLGR